MRAGVLHLCNMFKFAEIEGQFTREDLLGSAIAEGPAYVIQQKFDGARGALVSDSNGTRLVQKRIVRCDLQYELPEGFELDGELMPDGRFHAFDLVKAHGKWIDKLPLWQRLQALETFLNSFTCPHQVQRVTTLECTPGSILKAFDEVVYQGGEGIVIKAKHSTYGEAGAWTRIKKCRTDVFKIAAVDVDKRTITLGIQRPGVLKIIGKVGGLSGADARQASASIGAFVEVTFHSQTNSGALREPRFNRFRFDLNFLS